MRVLWVSLTGILAVASTSRSHADEYGQMQQLWSDGKYQEVLPLLRTYRRESQLHRTWQLDYMIGTSVCHSSQAPDVGEWYLSQAQRYPNATREVRQDAGRELVYCATGHYADAEPQPAFDMVAVAGQVGASWGGKMADLHPWKADTTSVSKPIAVPVAQLRQRVFAPDQGPAAIASAKGLLGGGATGIVASGYTVVCESACGTLELQQTASCLASYEAPLREEFGLLRPEPLVTVYLANNVYELPQLASRLHGLILPQGLIAYSVREDLSIVGIRNGACGTLAHELVHLSMRGSFADSPAWLEEGLASEVAVAQTTSPTAFHFVWSWRDDTLSTHWQKRRPVAELLAKTWPDFSSTDPSALDGLATLHATAAVFVRYMDEEHKLTSTYQALRDREPSDAALPLSDTQVLERELGKPLAAIDADFAHWFEGQMKAPNEAHPK